VACRMLTRALGGQLRGIDKKIAALKTELTYSSTGDRDQYLAGISSLQSEKAKLAQGSMGAHHDSDSERSDTGSTSVKDEEDAATPPASHGAGDCDSDSDEDTSAADADDAHDHAQDSGELIGAGITVTQKELREHFHLPLHTVAKKLGMCTTAFKKLCRRFGIAKWPHRQLRGIDKKIAALKAELNYSTVDKESARRNLLKLEEEKAKLSQGAEWTGLGLDLEVEVCRGESDSSDREQQSSSRRVGIRNLLCDAEDDDDLDDKDGPDDGDAASDASEGHGGDEVSGVSGATVTEEILREHFHLPLQSVAKKLGMCTTALKKLCRRFAIAKWPHRQLRGIDKKIAALKAELNYSTVDKESARRNLVALEEEKARLSRVALGGGGSPACRGTPAHAKDSSQQAASRKRRAPKDEPEANKSARTGSDSHTADASALDLLAAVAGIDSAAPSSHAAPAATPSSGAGDISNLISAPAQQLRMFPETAVLSRERELVQRLQGGVRGDVGGLSSRGASARSTPRLEPLSPGVGPQLGQDAQRRDGPIVSPLLSSREAMSMGAIGPIVNKCEQLRQGGPASFHSLDALMSLLASGGGGGGGTAGGTGTLMGVQSQQMTRNVVGIDGNMLLRLPQLLHR